MIKYSVGDIVEVVFTDSNDESEGIEIGDVFRVIEYSEVPYCEPIDSDYDGNLYAFNQSQLELLGEWVEC